MKTFILSIICLVTASMVSAQTWLNPTVGDFLDPANWNTINPPSAGQDALFDTSYGTYDLSSTITFSGDRTIRYAFFFGGDFTIQTGVHTWTITDPRIWIGRTTGALGTVPANVTIDGGNIDASGTQVLVGQAGIANNSLNLINGASFTTTAFQARIGSATSGNSLAVSGGSSFITGAAGLIVGNNTAVNNNTATLSGNGSSIISGGNITVGRPDNTGNSLVINDGNLTTAGLIQVGSGNSVIHNGGVISTQGTNLVSAFSIGNGSGAVANFVTNDGTHVFQSGLTIEADGILSGTGSLTGDIVTTANGTLAPGITGIGTLTLDSLDTSAGARFSFELGAGLTSDMILVESWDSSGVAVGSLFFDFTTLAGAEAGTYTIANFTSQTGLSAEHFAGVVDGGFVIDSFTVNANSLEVTIIPEPSFAAILMSIGALIVLFMRRKGLPLTK